MNSFYHQLSHPKSIMYLLHIALEKHKKIICELLTKILNSLFLGHNIEMGQIEWDKI